MRFRETADSCTSSDLSQLLCSLVTTAHSRAVSESMPEMNPLRSLFRYKDVKTFQNPTSLKAAAQAAFGCIGKSAESRAAAHEACTSHAKQQCMPNVPKVHIVEGNVGGGLDPSQTSPASQLQDKIALPLYRWTAKQEVGYV